jgi:hypothetical protein
MLAREMSEKIHEVNCFKISTHVVDVCRSNKIDNEKTETKIEFCFAIVYSFFAFLYRPQDWALCNCGLLEGRMNSCYLLYTFKERRSGD